jgi:hypothetical protein
MNVSDSYLHNVLPVVLEYQVLVQLAIHSTFLSTGTEVDNLPVDKYNTIVPGTVPGTLEY